MTALENNLKRYRREAGLSQQQLAVKAGVSRQAYAAVEAGKASPSTEVALRLARALGTQVESLFALAGEHHEPAQADLVEATDLGQTLGSPRRARLWRVGPRLLARPIPASCAARDALVDAEGMIFPMVESGNKVSVLPFDDDELDAPSVAMLGCDPAVALLEPGLRRDGVGLVAVEEGSYKALSGLARGEAHVAGCHLRDETTGDYNHSWVERLVPFTCTLVTFASWQQGLILTPGNPKGIGGLEDLARSEIAIVNREEGSGSRALLDRLLSCCGIPTEAVEGYNHEASGHLAVARAVASGTADAGVGVKAAASALGLGFLPLEEERYDLVIPNHLLDEPGVQALLNLLRRPSLHRRVEALGGYDVSSMGIQASRN